MSMHEPERWRAWAWLSRFGEPGNPATYRLVQELGPEAAVAELRCAKAGSSAGVGSFDDQVERDLVSAGRSGIRMVTPDDDEWPHVALHRMQQAFRRGAEHLVPPLSLWARGPARLDEATARAVGIASTVQLTGQPTSHAVTAIQFLTQDLPAHDWTVIADGDYGVTSAAHRAVLTNNGVSVAVFAGGLNRLHPQGHSTLFQRIARTGLLISEWPPDTPPARAHLPLRDRLIAGLSTGIVVAEAPAGSIPYVARCAARLGLPVTAAPGLVGPACPAGTNGMIHRGQATLVSSVDHVLAVLGSSPRRPVMDHLGVPPPG
jgi:DNA processing protein